MRPLLTLWAAGLLATTMLPVLAQTAAPAPAATAAPAPAPAPAVNTTKADRAKLKADQKKRQGDKIAGRTAAKSADKVQLQNDRAKVSSDTGGAGTTATTKPRKGKKRS